MAGRTVAIGDIHGDLAALDRLLGELPPLDAHDTLVFLGDYVDRGPDSAGVIERVSGLRVPARVVPLKGNHEAAWLLAMQGGSQAFVLDRDNGTLACLRSYRPGPPGELRTADLAALRTGTFFTPAARRWMERLFDWYEDEHAIYVHAGLIRAGGRWLHPAETSPRDANLWTREPAFFREYEGKRVVVGHTQAPSARDPVWAIDTGAGKGGRLTALILPELRLVHAR